MKKWKIIAPLFLAVTFITGLAVGKFLTAYNDAHSPISAGSSSQKIASILQLIEDKYVDNVDKDSLTNDAISKILSELDPHSVYISAEDLQTANDDLEGSFSGIGVQFNMLDDTLLVIQPVPK